jgi:hypothetical protein
VLIALDHDGTYTADPSLWNAWIENAQEHGHEVLCITMRYPTEPISMPCEVVYTSRLAKGPHMAALGRMPDIWIDDKPHWIFQSSH